MTAGHPTGTEHAQHASVVPGGVLRADRRVGAHAHVLQHAVVEDRQRLAAARGQQEDQAAVRAGLDAVLLLGAGSPYSTSVRTSDFIRIA
jgi:hypothetical protein